MAILGGVYRVSGLLANGLSGGLLGLLFRSPMIPLTFTLPVAGPVPHEFEDVQEVAPQLQECQEANDNIQLVVVVVDQDEEPIDISTASSLKLILLAPDGTTIEKLAALLTSGVDGAMKYDTVATDLVEAGLYQIQGEYVIAGKTQSTRRGSFRVRANIE